MSIFGIFKSFFSIKSEDNFALYDEDGQIKERKQRAIKESAPYTLDLLEGITEKQRQLLLEFFIEHYWLNYHSDLEDFCKENFYILENSGWKWKEWEYWQPICDKLQLYTLGMKNVCMPFLIKNKRKNKLATEFRVFMLLYDTILKRADDWEKRRVFQAFNSMPKSVNAAFPMDAKLYQIALKDKNNPWHNGFLPNMPGLDCVVYHIKEFD